MCMWDGIVVNSYKLIHHDVASQRMEEKTDISPIDLFLSAYLPASPARPNHVFFVQSDIFHLSISFLSSHFPAVRFTIFLIPTQTKPPHHLPPAS